LTAPGLVQAFNKFKGRGVAFVSVTNASRSANESFVESFDIPWPCGYGARMEDVVEYGAYDPHRPTFEVLPTIYIMDSAGHILWDDNHARPRHRMGPESLMEELSSAIENALQAEEAHNSP
jgi:hypothetical protein